MLTPNAVQVWSFGLSPDDDELNRLRQLLADDELARVERFRTAQLRQAAIAARGRLRQILSSYTHIQPAALIFDYAAQGKPFLPGSPLQFNLSHSGEWGVCAVALEAAVGVDVERIRTDFDLDELARVCFSQAELDELATYPPECAVHGFFRCWTFKEAYIKARGGGLSIPLDAFDVPLGSNRADAPVQSRDIWSTDGAGWYLRELSIHPSVAAAVAFRQPDFRVELQRWPEPPPT